MGNPDPLMFLETQETRWMLNQSLPDSDIAQATEFSRQARASGIYFPAIESGGARNPPLGVSGTSATMDSFDLAGNEELQAWLQGKTIPRLNHPLPISIDNIPRDVPGATPANLDEVGLENEVVLPTSTGPISDARSSHTDSLSLSAGDAHTGLEVFTVRDLMPRGNADTSNGSFESDAFIRNQEVSSNSAQTLSVRRSTFVPGWAMPPRVLLVDDDAITRKLSSNLLKIFGCTTDVAVDGLSAVNKMNLKKYDLVLMVAFPLACLRSLGLIAVHAGYSYAEDGWHLRDVDDKEIRPANTHHFDDEQLAASGNYDLLLLRCVLLLSSPCTFADRAQA